MAVKKTSKIPTAKAKNTQSSKGMKELEKKIGKVPVFFKELMKTQPDMHEAVLAFDQHIWDDGALSRKTKKILAISIAAALRDQHAVKAQLAGAKRLGVTSVEIEFSRQSDVSIERLVELPIHFPVVVQIRPTVALAYVSTRGAPEGHRGAKREPRPALFSHQDLAAGRFHHIAVIAPSSHFEMRRTQRIEPQSRQ